MMLVSTPGNPCPDGAVTGLIQTPDGVALRFARWDSPADAREDAKGDTKGTVCVFTGRSEFIEKYFETVRELRQRGFAVATIDWRGQGHSSRQLPDPRKGHVARFSDFEIDVATFMQLVVLPHVRRPIMRWRTRWAAPSCCVSRIPASAGSNAWFSPRR